MAKYRHVHTAFWEDPKVLEEMTPEDKYFYLYLLTNPKTTQIGVYAITKKQMAFDLGYSTESVTALLDRFINNHKLIKYNEETRELAIIHWGKYNLYKAGKPVIDCIKKELVEVKDKTLLAELMNHIPNESINNEFLRHVHDTSTTSGQKEKEKEKEKISTITKRANAFEVYEQNFGMLKPLVIDDINYWIEQLNEEVVVESMKIAVKRNKTSFGYCEGILKSWINQNVKTLADVQALALRNERPQVNIGTHTKQNGGYPNESDGTNRQSSSNESVSLNDLSL
ncbi:DnaD domain protein [Priestia sp. SB1]|uniref:DnaD domain-containing protein n=1 Tax=Priestia sp. SB1 TaxID=3132359 RepID=UPI003178C425